MPGRWTRGVGAQRRSESGRPDLCFGDVGCLQRPDDPVHHRGQSRDQVGEGLQLVAEVVMEELGFDASGSPSRRRMHRPSTPRPFGEVTTETCRRDPFSSSYGGSSSVTQN